MKQSEVISAELVKYKKDPIYFIESRIKVVHPIRGLVPFKLYPFQKKIVRELQENRFNILRKFRQAGCTTIVAAYTLWMMLFRANTTIAVLSKDDEAAKEVLERIKIMYDEIPAILKPKIRYRNSHNLKLRNGSRLQAKAPSKEAGRSISANLLIVDEGAFIEHIDTIWGAAYPVISTGGAAFILSTVNGIGNWYYKMWQDAVRGINDFNAIEIGWGDHPEYKRTEGYEHLYLDMLKYNKPINIDDWESTTRKNIGPKRWLQEYECEFLGTGDTYVDGEILRYLKKNVNKEYWNRYNNRMRVWKDAEPQYDYVMSVDTSMGRGGDNSAFHVFNVYNGEQVAEFYSNKTPINELAKIVCEVATEYNTAMVTPERNTIGNNLIDRLFNDLEYENIYMDDKGLLGVQVQVSNREVMLANMEEDIRLNIFKVNSERTVDELLTFIVNNVGKAEADEGCYDDLVMSLALAAFGFRELTGGTLVEFKGQEQDNNLIPPKVQTTYKMRSYGGYTEEEYLEWMK